MARILCVTLVVNAVAMAWAEAAGLPFGDLVWGVLENITLVVILWAAGPRALEYIAPALSSLGTWVRAVLVDRKGGSSLWDDRRGR